MPFEKLDTNPPSGTQPQTLSIKKNKKVIKASLTVFYIKDGEFMVALMPGLNLSGYGKDKAQAEIMLRDVLDDYFESLIKLKQNDLNAELAKYGWKHTPYSKQFQNTAHVDKKGILRNLNMPNDTPIEKSTLQVA